MEISLKNALNLSNVINASGKMTKLGVSKISDKVCDAMKIGGQNFFEMDELYKKSGNYIAKSFATESGFITNSASSALVLTIAAQINKGNIKYVEYFHKYLNELNREVVMPKGHNINYGTTVEGMINLGGGILVEAGSSNECTVEQVESNINEKTVALLYIKSHHCVQKNTLSIDEMQELASKYNIPLIVDAAAEDDFTKYNKYDLVIFSGAKALEGPSSGIIIGKAKFINNLFVQNIGIGRAMKVDKTIIFGLLQAVKTWHEKAESKEKINCQNFINNINNTGTLEAKLIKDEAGREIYRIELSVKEHSLISAKDIAKELKTGDNKIFTRDYQANLGKLQFDTRSLKQEDLDIIFKKIQIIIGK